MVIREFELHGVKNISSTNNYVKWESLPQEVKKFYTARLYINKVDIRLLRYVKNSEFLLFYADSDNKFPKEILMTWDDYEEMKTYCEDKESLLNTLLEEEIKDNSKLAVIKELLK